jgi:hypothetical protein
VSGRWCGGHRNAGSGGARGVAPPDGVSASSWAWSHTLGAWLAADAAMAAQRRLRSSAGMIRAWCMASAVALRS